MAESLKLAPSEVNPKTSENMTTNLSNAKFQPLVMAQTNTSAAEEEKIKAAGREKRRTVVRSMIIERVRYPLGEPFE